MLSSLLWMNLCLRMQWKLAYQNVLNIVLTCLICLVVTEARVVLMNLGVRGGNLYSIRLRF